MVAQGLVMPILIGRDLSLIGLVAAWPRSRHSVSNQAIIRECQLQCHLAGDLPEEEEEEGRKNKRVWIASCLSYILLYLSDVV